MVTNDGLIELAVRRGSSVLETQQLSALEADLTALFNRVGAATRYHRSPGEKALDFGVAAARQALEDANFAARDVDLLIYAGVSRGFLEPATANAFHDALGLSNATCFDVLDACASWLRAFDVAVHLLQGGNYSNALIINCEFNFEEYFPVLDSLGNFGELEAGFTIGEAATATLIGGSRQGNAYYATFKNHGAGNALCQIPLPHAKEFLNGSHKPLWRPMEFYSQSTRLHAMAINALQKQYWEDERFHRSRYDIIFSHAAGLPASKKVAQKLSLDTEKHYEIFPQYGNTVSASLPLSISLALQEGKLRRGDLALLVVGSAGVTSALGLLEF